MSEHQQNTQTETPETEDTLAGVSQITLVTNESEEFHIDFNDKIRLYFLRYGLFAKYNKEEHLISPDSKENQEESLVLPTLEVAPPSLEHFEVGRTALNSGYLYLFNEWKRGLSDEENKNLFYEYKIHIDGRAQTIYEPVYEAGQRTNDGNLEDHRVSSGEFETKKEFEKDQILWIGYSQVQWTGKYHREMLDAGAEERKNKGLVRVNCAGFPDGFGQEHVLQQSQVRAMFREDQKASDIWCDNILNQINIYENKVKPDIKRDMFVVLPDPIGCAMDITQAINVEFIKHQANIEAMKTGTHPDAIYQAIDSDGEIPNVNPHKENNQAMFNLALSAYQMVYNDPDNTDIYGGSISISSNTFRNETTIYRVVKEGISKQKLENILGVDERKKQRDRINKLRRDLNTYLFDDYYTDSYEHHLSCDVPQKLEGKYSIINPFSILYTNPHDVDKGLDLTKDYEEDPVMDTSFEMVFEELEGKKIRTLWEEKINVTDIMLQNYGTLAVFLEGVSEGIISMYQKSLSISQNQVLPILTKIAGQFTTLNLRNKPLVQLAMRSVSSMLSSERIFFSVPQLISLEIDERLYTPKLSANVRANSSSPISSQIVVNGSQEGTIRFFKLPDLLLFVNTIAALGSIRSNPSWRNSVNLISTFVSLGEAFVKYRVALYQKSPESTLAKFGAGVGIAAGFLTITVAVMDSYARFNAKDKNASASYMMSALAVGGAMLTTGGLALFFFVIAIGFSFLAAYLTDTPLQAFFKNFAFRINTPTVPFTNSWEYNKLFERQRDRHSNLDRSGVKEFEGLSNFKDDLAALTNIITRVNVTFISKRFRGQSGADYADSYSAIIELSSILKTASENLEAQIIYHSGLPNAPSLNYVFTKIVALPSTNTSITRIQADFTIYGDFLDREVLGNRERSSFGFFFLFQFKIEDGISFPPTFSNGESYYYSVFQRLHPGAYGSDDPKNASLVTLDGLTDNNSTLRNQIEELLP